SAAAFRCASSHKFRNEHTATRAEMLLNQKKQPRRGAVLIESALIYPVVFVLMLGIVILGVAVFRYQMVASAAREASRYASVPGAMYATETSNTAIAPDDGLWSGGS